MAENRVFLGTLDEEARAEFFQAVEEIFASIDITRDLPWPEEDSKGKDDIQRYCTAFMARVRNSLTDENVFVDGINDSEMIIRAIEVIAEHEDDVTYVFNERLADDSGKHDHIKAMFKEHYIGKLGSMISERVLPLVPQILEITPEEWEELDRILLRTVLPDDDGPTEP